jgi:predicted ATPase with chaperone activity
VLFLDELPEFHRRSLEVLRQPLEAGRVTISRALNSTTFPARFVLVTAMNRIDMHIEVPAVPYQDLSRARTVRPAPARASRSCGPGRSKPGGSVVTASARTAA